jgi:mono/diheme cytochrome c family protein
MERTAPCVCVFVVAAFAAAQAFEPADRGRKALQTRAFNPAGWSLKAYDEAWRHWGKRTTTRPEPYDEAFRDHYGLHPAPYGNGRYPMGLRPGRSILGGKGLTVDCLVCHASSILGKSYVGLGNSSLDVHALFEDMNMASGIRVSLPFTFSNVRGTSEAGGFATYLHSLREPDLSLRLKRLDLDLRDDLCEDVPAWWLLKKKKTMYFTGTTDARSVRSLMQFMLVPGNGLAVFEREEATFRDIQAYLLSLEAPRYPFPIDEALADHGQVLFTKTCARCHGTYGRNWSYPNKIVPLEEIGTDPTRFGGLSRRLGEHYNRSWFAREKRGWLGDGYQTTRPKGYQAPPLDGIWATAPYFHNGSVPTVYNVLDSQSRPKIFTRSFRTDDTAYDREKLGWKVQVLRRAPSADLPAYERRQVYDTTQQGRGNGGHTFGDAFSDEQRRAVIEYLKTL